MLKAGNLLEYTRVSTGSILEFHLVSRLTDGQP